MGLKKGEALRTKRKERNGYRKNPIQDCCDSNIKKYDYETEEPTQKQKKKERESMYERNEILLF